MTVPWDPVTLCEELTDGIAVLERDGTCVYVNAAAERLVGVSRAVLVGASFWSHAGALASLQDACARVTATGAAETTETCDVRLALQRWLSVRVSASGGRVHLVATDVTPARRTTSRLRAVSELSRGLGEVQSTPDAVLGLLTRLASEALGELVVANILGPDGATIERCVVHGPDADAAASVRAALAEPRPLAGTYTERALVAGGPVHVAHEGLIIVPLRLAERAFGALVAIRPVAAGPHDAIDEQFLITLAERATTALVRTLVRDPERRHAQRQQILSEVSDALASSVDPLVLFERVAAIMAARFGHWVFVDRVLPGDVLDRIAVEHRDPGSLEVTRPMRRRYPARVDDIRAGASLAISHGRAVVDNDFTDAKAVAAARDPEHLAGLRAMRIRAYVSAPLVIGGTAAGALTVASSTRTFDPDDVDLVEQIAGRAASVLANVELYERSQALLRWLERMQAVTSELSRARTPMEVAEVTVRNAGKAVAAESVMVWSRQPDGSLLLVGGKAHVEAELQRWVVLPAGSNMPAFRVLETGEPMWIETEEDYRRLAPEVYEIQRVAHRLRAYCVLPLTTGGARTHVLVFSFPLGHRYTGEERGYLLSLARQTEQALERAALFAAEASARAQADSARLAAEAASRAKDEFLAMLGHELRNPLAPIVTALELIKLRAPELAQAKELTVIGRHVQHLARLVDDLLDISRITRGTVSLERKSVRLSKIIARSMEMASPLLEQRRHSATVDVPDELRVHGDAMRLAQVFGTPLTNAARHNPPGGPLATSRKRRDPRGQIHRED